MLAGPQGPAACGPPPEDRAMLAGPQGPAACGSNSGPTAQGGSNVEVELRQSSIEIGARRRRRAIRARRALRWGCMSDALDQPTLLARHAALKERAQRLATESPTGDRHTEAVRVLNQLAEAYAWLGPPSTSAAVTSASSLLASAEERLGRLERPTARRASGATRIR